jgi:hypothetical protein
VCIECGKRAAWRCDCGSFACDRHSVQRSTSHMLERASYFHEVQYASTVFRVCAKCLRAEHEVVLAAARAKEEAARLFKRFIELAAPLGFPGTALFYPPRSCVISPSTRRGQKAWDKASRKLRGAALDAWRDGWVRANRTPTVRGWDIRPHTCWHGDSVGGSSGRQVLLTDGTWACCYAPYGTSLVIDEHPRNSQVPDLVEIAPLLIEIARKNAIPVRVLNAP